MARSPKSQTLNVNGKRVKVAVDPTTPLLWVLRDELELTGTKYACGIAQCGACTVHIDGQAIRACVYPVSAVNSKQKIVTIEGLSADDSHPVQQAWAEFDVPQCGYCQPGMIMASAALLNTTPRPTDADIDTSITNICRCGTLPRVRRGIHRAAQLGYDATAKVDQSTDEVLPQTAVQATTEASA